MVNFRPRHAWLLIGTILAALSIPACGSDARVGDPIDLSQASSGLAGAWHADASLTFTYRGESVLITRELVDLAACTLDDAQEREFWVYEDEGGFLGEGSSADGYHLYVAEDFAVGHISGSPDAFASPSPELNEGAFTVACW